VARLRSGPPNPAQRQRVRQTDTVWAPEPETTAAFDQLSETEKIYEEEWFAANRLHWRSHRRVPRHADRKWRLVDLDSDAGGIGCRPRGERKTRAMTTVACADRIVGQMPEPGIVNGDFVSVVPAMERAGGIVFSPVSDVSLPA
jgi:hypothetical protein